MKWACQNMIRLMLSIFMMLGLLAPAHAHEHEDHHGEHCAVANGVHLEHVPCDHECSSFPDTPDLVLPQGQKTLTCDVAFLAYSYRFNLRPYSAVHYVSSVQLAPPLLHHWCSVRLLC